MTIFQHHLLLTPESLDESKGYAKALFELAKDKQKLDEVFTSLECLNAVFEQCPDIVKFFLQHDEVAPAALEEALSPVLQQLEEWVRKTISLMLKQEHYRAIPALYSTFVPLYEEAQGVGHVHLTSAVALTEDLCQELQAHFASIFKLSKVILHTTVDAKIIGGLYVEYKGLRFDATLKRKLASFEEALSQI